MQIACPACQTRYSVPDGAIPPEGRTVRCAKCRHSWHEGGNGAEPSEVAMVQPPASDGATDGERPAAASPEQHFAAPETPPQPMPAASDAYAETPVDDAVASGADGSTESEWPAAPELDTAPEVAAAVPAAAVAAPQAASEPVSDYAEPMREEEWDEPAPRKSRLGLVFIVILVLLAVAAAAFTAVRYYGAPAWLPTGPVAFAPPSEDLELDFPQDKQDRKTLPNGLQFFAASGTVKNIGDTTRHVPDVQVVLRDAQERIVYTWELEPPKRELAPGETVSINEAVTDVPASARIVEIGWKAS